MSPGDAAAPGGQLLDAALLRRQRWPYACPSATWPSASE
jgi:hypothetical protein